MYFQWLLPFNEISERVHFSQSQIQASIWIYFEFTFVQSRCYRNHSSTCIALETIKETQTTKHKSCTTDFFFGFCSTGYINTAGWLDRGKEGSCCHYGGITARQPWCDGWAHPRSFFLLSPLIHSTDLWNPTKHQKLNSEVWVWKPSGKPPHSPPLVSSRERSHSFFLKSFHC